MQIEDAVAASAERIGGTSLDVLTVLAVEASGAYLGPDGEAVRRHEPHHLPNSWWNDVGFHPGDERPWRASLHLTHSQRVMIYEKAKARDAETAARASSWGAPQIMGFNHDAAGHATALKMVRAFRSPAAQIEGFTSLILDWKLDRAIRSHDWLAFAAPYNGTGQAPEYARRLALAYHQLSGRPSVEVLRIGARGQSVAALQELLGIVGHDVTIDGSFGATTRDAVERFQEAAGLVVDGVVGARTWTALRETAAIKPEIEPEPQPEAPGPVMPEPTQEETKRSLWPLLIDVAASALPGAGLIVGGLARARDAEFASPTPGASVARVSRGGW